MAADLFPELDTERAHLAFARGSRSAGRLVRRTGAPPTWHRMVPRAQVSGNQDLAAVDRVHELDGTEISLFGPEVVKGLEFDGVIAVNPHEILSEGTDRAGTYLVTA